MGVFGVCRTDTCTFSNFRIYPGHGVTYIRVDGKVNPVIMISCSLHSVRGVNLRIGVWVCGGRWTARRIGAPCPAGLGTFSGRILLLLSCRLEGDHRLGLSLSIAAETQPFNSCSHRLVCHGLASFVDAMVGLLQLGKPWTGERDTANGCWELLSKRPCVCDAWRSGTDIEQMCSGSRSVSLMARPRLAFT